MQKTSHLVLQLLLLILLASALFISCQKEPSKSSWNTNLLLPLVADTVFVSEILDERFFIENPDQSISLAFEEELFDLNMDSLAYLPDTLIFYGLRLGFIQDSLIHQPGDTILSQSFSLPIDIMNGNDKVMILKKAILNSGNITFEAHQVSQTNLLVVLGIDGLESGEGEPFLQTETVENDVHFTKTIDVSDYKMDFTGPNHDTSNILTYNVALIVPPEHEGEVTIYPHDSVALNVYFKDVILDYAQGFFGQELFMFGPQTQELQILEDLQLNKLSLGESEIKLHITNTYGVDVNTQLLDLIATNTHTQESILLESDLLNTDLWIGRAQETNVYDSIIPYEASFDFSQSNLAEMISILPDKLNFFLNIETNVGADSTETNDFVYLNKPMSVQLQAKVNGGVSFDHLFQSAQMQWNGQGLNLEKIESGHLKLIFDNAMPFSFIMNLYLENEEKEIIDTLVFERNITAGIIGNENFVVESTRSYEEIPINESLKNSLAETKYSTYDLWISSANGEQIQIHKNNYLQFKVIGDFTYLMEQ